MLIKFEGYDLDYSIENDNIVINHCFYHDNNVSKVIIPSKIDNKNVIRIKDNCFDASEFNPPYDDGDIYDELNLQHVQHCECWATEIVVEEGIEVIEEKAFFNCPALQVISLPSTLKEFKTPIFEEFDLCPVKIVFNNNKYFSSGKDSNIIIDKVSKKLLYADDGESLIDNDLEVIGSNAFYGLSCLQQLIIPEGIKVIEKAAFNNCNNLRRLVLPSTLVSCDKHAIENCINLKDVVIPDNVSIDIDIPANNKPSFDEDAF